jgi:hypothetical protein
MIGFFSFGKFLPSLFQNAERDAQSTQMSQREKLDKRVEAEMSVSGYLL